jgi:hypothetical protein
LRVRPAATALVLAAAVCACGRQDRTSPEKIRLQIARLERERGELRVRLDGLLATDEGARSMPETPVRIGVPTSLARRLIETVSSGFVDQITLQLSNLKAKKSGTVRKVVTIGAYDLDVTIDRVSGELRTTRPDVHFEGNAVKLALPVRVASGSGQATVRFKWDGRNLAGAACGDLDVEQVVSGSVKPRDYSVSGTLQLQATGSRILVTPRIPPLRVKLEVEPSKQSWVLANPQTRPPRNA